MRQHLNARQLEQRTIAAHIYRLGRGLAVIMQSSSSTFLESDEDAEAECAETAAEEHECDEYAWVA